MTRLARTEIMANHQGFLLIEVLHKPFQPADLKAFWRQIGNQPALLVFALSGNLAI
jgi:hypothetical protein